MSHFEVGARVCRVVISPERLEPALRLDAPGEPGNEGQPARPAARPRVRDAPLGAAFRAFVEEVRQAASLVDVIGADVALAPSGKVLKGLSPFNAERTPSLVVWPENQTWRDFSGGGPGRGGDVFEYLCAREGLSFKEALLKLAARLGVKRPGQNEDEFQRELGHAAELRGIRALLTEAAAYYHVSLPRKIRDRYYRQHYGLTDETIDGLQLGWANGHLFEYFTAIGVERDRALKTGLFVATGEAGPVHDFFRDRLVFPYWKVGQVAYFIARRTEFTDDDSWEQAKYKKLLTRSARHPYVSVELVNDTFYNEDAARGADELLITEGVTDCISARQAGVPCISPVTTRFRDEDAPKLVSLTRTARRVVVCNDAETSGAGAAGALVTAELLHLEGRDVRIALLPRPDGAGKIDLNEYLKNHSPDDLRVLLREAKPYLEHLIDAVPRDLPPAELEAGLEPVFCVLARGTALEQDRYGQEVRRRFKLRERTVKELFSKAQAANASRATADSANSEKLAPVAVLPGVEHLVRDTVPELPADIASDARVPRGWAVRDGALYEVRVGHGEAAAGPEYSIVSRGVVLPIKSVETELGEFVSVRFRSQEFPVWRSLTAPRETLATARLIVSLASHGFPVTSNEAAALVRFAAEYSASNAIPRATGRASCGWVDQRTFLLGNEVVGERTIELVLHPDDEIGHGIVKAIGCSGQELDHLQLLAEAIRRSRAVALGLALSFAAPYLEACNLPSVGAQFFGMGGEGKTSAMRLCMSPWGSTGDASRTTAGGIVRPASGTPKALLDSARVTNGLPFAAVDINADLLASRYAREQMAHVAQCLVDGTGLSVKRRTGFGNRTGGNWRSTVLLDGEVPVGELASREGLGRRFLQISGPFIDEGLPRELAELAVRAAKHFGHSGHRVIEHLVELGQEERQEIRARCDAHLATLLSTSGVDSEPYVSWARGAAVALAISEDVTRVLALDVGDVWQQQILAAWHDLLGDVEAPVEDESRVSELERAKRCLTELAASLRGRLLTPAGTIPVEAANINVDWCGKIEDGAEDEIWSVAIRSQLVREALKRAEHSPASVIRELARTGFIRRPDTAQGRRGALTFERRLRGMKVLCYILELESAPF